MIEAWCGIDVGTQGVRVAVLSAEGEVLATGAAPLVASQRAGRRHEQDPHEWWTALCAAATAAGLDRFALAAVALDATSGTVLVEQADGTPAGPALMYDDTRAAEEAEVAQRAGAPLWDALGYRMQPSWGLPKLLWLRRAGAIGRGGRVVHQADHLVRRLTGAVCATDTSNALKTGADLRDATWPHDVFAELGIPEGMVPDLALPGTVLGRVSAAAATATGLPAGVPVKAGMTDGCAAQIASGALAPGSWSSALGTTLVVKGSTCELVRDPGGAVYSHRHPDGGWLPGGASNSGAGVLARAFADRDLGALTRAAAPLVPFDAPAYPLDGTGERFPFLAPDAHGFGADQAADAERFAVLCQSIAYVERLAYEVLGRLGADVSGPVALTGGATRNEWWNQVRTDVLGRPTLRPGSAEAAVGMAVLAAAEPGTLTATAQRMVRVAQRYTPDAERHAAFDRGYAAFVDALAERGWLSVEPAR